MLTAVATNPTTWPVAFNRPAAARCENPPNDGAIRLWIAIEQALGGIDEWREEHTRCAFVERGHGRALVVEASGDIQLCISYRELNAQGDLEDVVVWSLTLDDDGIRDVSMSGAPARGSGMEALTDLFWVFHRLAVEDRASMLRS